MATIELKFLLQLLSFSGYRASLSQIQPSAKTSSSERNKTCSQLCDRGLIDCSQKIVSFKIAPAGKALLKLKSELPVSGQELKVLKACEDQKVTPEQLNIRPAAEKQALLRKLTERGLIQAETKIDEIWLSERGKAYLRSEYSPKGSGNISLSLLNCYLRFLRQPESSNGSSPQTDSIPAKFSDAEVLQVIQTLDRKLGSQNYLPLFHLRQKLQPLSRDELDQVLYRLQRQDQIELSSLQDATRYTADQVEAGIPQDIGGSLFFVTVV
ncbi:transcription factor RcaD [Oculatella sp. FACHB-28]|nr:transcription factor RcaD [Oculatella sp. FACHB-28]